MSEVNVIEGNKLIATFDGWKFELIEKQGLVLVSGSCYFKDTWEEVNKFCGEKLKYHTSWDWLMPVVEKIEHEITPVEILDFQCRISRTIYNPEQILTTSDESKIAAVYNAVVQFIKFYNNNSTQ
jgi:hypothetical protein